MKRLTLTAICTATVEEAWTFDVPDDFDTSGTPEEVYERAMGERESPDGVKFSGVENVEVNDERDREWRAFSATPMSAVYCKYVFDGTDTDGTAWHRCTIHDELAPSADAPCAGYYPEPYKEVTR